MYMNVEVRLDRLIELMQARNMSAADLARASGGNEATISLALSRKRNPSVPTLVQWARALGCSLDYLVGLSDNPRPRHGEPPPPGGIEILDVMRKLHPEVAAELVRVARAMVAAQNSAEGNALATMRAVINQVGDDDARALLVDALRLAEHGHGQDAMAQVEGYIARLEGAHANNAHQEAGNHV